MLHAAVASHVVSLLLLPDAPKPRYPCGSEAVRDDHPIGGADMLHAVRAPALGAHVRPLPPSSPCPGCPPPPSAPAHPHVHPLPVYDHHCPTSPGLLPLLLLLLPPSSSSSSSPSCRPLAAAGHPAEAAPEGGPGAAQRDVGPAAKPYLRRPLGKGAASQYKRVPYLCAWGCSVIRGGPRGVVGGWVVASGWG